MDFASTKVKLNNIKTYDSKTNNTTSVFKKKFYSDTSINSFDTYEDIDYNSIDLSNYDEKENNRKINLIQGVDRIDNYKPWYVKAGATLAVGATTILSAKHKINEYILDGATWISGMIVSGVSRLFGQKAFAEKVENWTMDEIAKDKIGELNKIFYEDTSIGRKINDSSKLKYDSDTAKGMQNIATEAIIIAGATAATVATGGAAEPLFVVGFAIGSGQSAEKKFQDEENRNFWNDSIEIGIDGTIEGLSTVAYGKAGASAVNGVKALAESGVKTTVKETLKAFNKNAIKASIKTNGKKIIKNAALDTLKDKDNWSETTATLLDDVKSGVQTGEWNIAKMLFDAALIYGENYIGNLTGEILSDSVNKIDRITQLYSESQDAANDKYLVGFKSYRDHAEKHVYYVASYMQDISKNVDNINVDEALFASLAHDLGMKGGYVKYNGKYIKADTLLDIIGKDNISFSDINNYVRKPHPLNSALTVLTDDIIPDGVDKDVVALLAMSHSKSTSGIKYFDNKSQWNNCIDELEAALKQYNLDNGTSFTFDTDKLKKMLNDNDQFGRLQKEALIIRDSDAMSAVATFDGDTIMHTGEISHVENKNPRLTFNDVVVDEKQEISELTDTLKGIDGDEGNVISGVKYHAGELNTKFSSETDGFSYYKGSVDLVEPNQVPNCTLNSIEERIGEINTYSNCAEREFTIYLPKEAEGTALDTWYKGEKDRIVSELLANAAKDYSSQEKIISLDTYERQKKFYNSIKIDYK